jgi:N-acetylmuramic acid 6-phosphate etherase
MDWFCIIRSFNKSIISKSSIKTMKENKRITEQSSLHDNLDKKSVLELLTEMNEEDRKVPLAVSKVIPQIEVLVTKIVERMQRGGRIFYLGAGTSGRLGVLDASEIPPTFGMPPHFVNGLIAGGDTALRNPVENAEDNSERGWEELVEKNININDVVIGIAASGTTPYVIGALRKARANGILTASISCNPNSPVSEEADIKIEVIVGPEFVTGSTRLKSGTAQKLVLNMITTVTMIQLGRVKGNKMVNMQLSNAKLVDRGTRMIIDELGLDYEKAKNILLIHGSVKKAVDAFRAQEKS